MKKMLALLVLALLLSGAPAPARADVAPPTGPSVGGLQPQYQSTMVQMMSEKVDIEYQTGNFTDRHGYPTRSQIVVSAYFSMLNQGNVEEQMQAIFPLDDMECRYAAYEINPDTFTVTVNDLPVATTTVTSSPPSEWCDPEFPWAAFDVTFPIGEKVAIRVNYILPEATMQRDSVFNFSYVLETGAAWNGRIGVADITFRMPFQPTDETIRPGTSEGYTIRDNEILWHWELFEPERQDNLNVKSLWPGTWASILALRKAVHEAPDDIESWIQLAEAYCWIGVSHYTFIRDPYYVDKATDAYQHAIALRPDWADLRVQFADFLWGMVWGSANQQTLTADLPSVQRVLQELSVALALDPNNWRANQLLDEMYRNVSDLSYTPMPTREATAIYPPTRTMIPWPTPTSFPTYTPFPTGTNTATRPPSPTHQPTWTRTVTQMPTASPTASPTATPLPPTPTVTTAPPTSTPTPQPPPGAPAGGILLLVGVVLLLAVGGVWWFFKRKD